MSPILISDCGRRWAVKLCLEFTAFLRALAVATTDEDVNGHSDLSRRDIDEISRALRLILPCFLIEDIRVRILLESPFNPVLLQVLLSLDRASLAEPDRILGAGALRVLLTEHVAELVGISVPIRTVISIHAALIVVVEDFLVAHIQLVRHRDSPLLTSHIMIGCVKEDARRKKDYLVDQLSIVHGFFFQ